MKIKDEFKLPIILLVYGAVVIFLALFFMIIIHKPECKECKFTPTYSMTVDSTHSSGRTETHYECEKCGKILIKIEKNA